MTEGCSPGCLCDCCTGIEQRTPRAVANPPARGVLAYRVGTHADFLATMLARLGTVPVPTDESGGSAGLTGTLVRGLTRPPGAQPDRPLAALTARTGDDFVVGLIDAWAVVLDVLTFYQERIANEGYLRTATEFRSVRELARLVGYAPRPGVSATAFLAYDVDSTSPVSIASGSKVQSVPAAGQVPQTFETAADLTARDRWSRLVPRKARPQTFEPGQTAPGRRVWFTGLTTLLKPNDPLLLVFDAARGEPFRVKSVTPDNPAQLTRVVLQDFRTISVLGDARAARREANRRFERAVTGFEEGVADLPPSRVTSAPGTTPITAIRTNAIDTIRTLFLKTPPPVTAEQIATLNTTIQTALDGDAGALPPWPGLRSVATDPDPGVAALADNLAVGYEGVQDYLTAQGIALKVIALKPLPDAPIQLSEPLAQRYETIRAAWQPAAIATLSPITLANLLQDTRQFVQDNFKNNPTTFAEVINLVGSDLGALVRALVRPVLSRFLRKSQSGITLDTAVADDVDFQLRNVLDKTKARDLPGTLIKSAADALQPDPALGRVKLLIDVVSAARPLMKHFADNTTVPVMPPGLVTNLQAVLTTAAPFLNALNEQVERLEDPDQGWIELGADPDQVDVDDLRVFLLAVAGDLVATPLGLTATGAMLQELANNLNPATTQTREDASRQANTGRAGWLRIKASVIDQYLNLRNAVANSALVAKLGATSTPVERDALKSALDAVFGTQPEQKYHPAAVYDLQPDKIGFGVRLQRAANSQLHAALITAAGATSEGRKAIFSAYRDADDLRRQLDGWQTALDRAFDRNLRGTPSTPAGPSRLIPTENIPLIEKALTDAKDSVTNAELVGVLHPIIDYLLGLFAPGENPHAAMWALEGVWARLKGRPGVPVVGLLPRAGVHPVYLLLTG